VRVTRIADGLWRWTGQHPDWTPDDAGPNGWEQEVGCVYYEAPDAIVLVDPLVPPEDAERFLDALDRDVERVGRPVRVVLTCSWHGRSGGELAERYGGEISSADVPGIVAYPALEEIVFWIPEHGALVFGDVVLGRDGSVRLCPESWLGEGVGHAELQESLRPLLELPVERLLVSHGEPVLEGGGAELARVLG
jgi:glyoxylase-like metal-dependent hydrolase (beta-lactamase superfamily II)